MKSGKRPRMTLQGVAVVKVVLVDRDVLDVGLGRVRVEGAVVLEEGDLLVDCEVLVAEENDAALFRSEEKVSGILRG